jgi:hypothetical protein
MTTEVAARQYGMRLDRMATRPRSPMTALGPGQ